jgi:hypothetical protein
MLATAPAGWSRTNVQIGAGWLVPETFTWLLTPGDFSGDGCMDIMGVRADDASLRLYEGSCASGWRRTNSQVGSGWGGFDWLLGSGR